MKLSLRGYGRHSGVGSYRTSVILTAFKAKVAWGGAPKLDNQWAKRAERDKLPRRGAVDKLFYSELWL